MANETTWALAKKFYMHTNLFFYPNEIYYGYGKIGVSLILNLVIYFIGMTFGIVRFLSSLSYTDQKKCLKEFTFSCAYILNMYAFMRIFPLKHAQYLMFIVVFVCFYFSDFFFRTTGLLLSKIKLKKIEGILSSLKEIAAIVFLLFILQIGHNMYKVKIGWTNQRDYEKLQNVLNTIPKEEKVFDLTGGAIFYPNGYFFCCIPYGQYEEALLFPMPSIEKTFENKNTKYVHTGTVDRLGILPGMQKKYILENFEYFTPDGSLLIKKNNL